MCVTTELISLLCLHMTYFLPPSGHDSCTRLFATLISLARFHSLTQHHAIPARYEGEIMEAVLLLPRILLCSVVLLLRPTN